MMRLQHGGAYRSDMTSLRSLIRSNGRNPAIQMVTVTHPLAVNAAVNVHINMAYEPNSAFPPINGSLYVVAFGNRNNTWHFNGLGAIGGVPGGAFPNGQTGDYGALGFAYAFPAINNQNLGNAVQAMSAYNGEPVDRPLRTHMVLLIIAVSEAARFGSVERGVDSVLGNGNVYNPDWNEIHQWGGHRLGD